MAKIKLNKSNIDKTCVLEGYYRDEELPGFCLKVTPTGKKVFLVNTKVKGTGKNVTVTIGIHGVEYTAEQARTRAKQILGDLAEGKNPNDMKKALKEAVRDQEAQRENVRKVNRITLRFVLDEYIAAKKLKPSTVYNYRCVVQAKLSDWLDKPIGELSKDMVANRHREISEHHPGEADNVMRVLRALFTFASYKYENTNGESIIVLNPVRRLSQNKQWNKLPRRQGVIKAHELKDWYQAVLNLDNTTVRDYLILLLFTGLRKAEAESLKWGAHGVDLKSRTLLVQETKNHEPLLLPLSEYLYRLMLARWQTRMSDEWVFPGENKLGHLSDPRYSINKVEQACGVSFTPHDLRRTFVTIADGLGIGQYTIKKLVNHKNSGDVTAGYFVAEVERLREPMEKITLTLLEHAGVSVQPKRAPRRSKVVPIKKVKRS